MANAPKSNLIRIYGVTLGEDVIRSYGHGRTKIKIQGKEFWVQYVDYFISDLISLIKQQGLEKKFKKGLE